MYISSIQITYNANNQSTHIIKNIVTLIYYYKSIDFIRFKYTCNIYINYMQIYKVISVERIILEI